MEYYTLNHRLNLEKKCRGCLFLLSNFIEVRMLSGSSLKTVEESAAFCAESANTVYIPWFRGALL